MQKVWIQLAAHRGKFPYDKDLGSRLYQVDNHDIKHEQKVLEAIEEALMHSPQVKVLDVTVTKDLFTVLIETEYGIDSIEIEMKGGS